MHKHFDWVQDERGNAIAGVSVRVYNTGTTTAATLYSDYSGATTITQPITTETDGYYDFFVAQGRYDIVLSKTGYTFDSTDMVGISIREVVFKTITVAENDVSKVVTGITGTPNASYEIVPVAPAWSTTIEVSSQTQTGFTLTFSTPVPAGVTSIMVILVI